MSDSKTTMARLAHLERDSTDVKKTLHQIANILADQSERIDRLGDRLDHLGDRLEARLDRLISVTIQERTYSIERFADIERRLARLEERVGP